MYIWTSNGSKITATLQGDYVSHTPGQNPVLDVFTLSRTMLRLHREDQQKLSVYAMTATVLGIQVFSASYYSDPNGDLEIPLKNIINKWPSEVLIAITLYEVGGNTAVDGIGATLEVYPGISYNDLNAPRNKECSDFFGLYAHNLIVPPNIMINPNSFGDMTAPGIIFESNFHDYDADLKWYETANGISAAITPTGSRNNQFQVANTSDLVYLADSYRTKSYPLTKPSYCSDLICLRWTSLTGATRQHFFPILAYIKGNDKETSLVTPGDGYDVTKAAFNGVRCKLDGLTQYGYWYYMDLLQASDVHGVIRRTLGNWAVEIASATTSVYVEGKTLETPNGVGFFSFEFTVKFRHYDTL